MKNEKQNVEDLILEFQTARQILWQRVQQAGNEEEISMSDRLVSNLFDRICQYDARDPYEILRIRQFAIEMISEICDHDELVINCLRLLERPAASNQILQKV